MSLQLTLDQKKHFVDHGYLHLPGAVSREACHAAMRAINHSVGQGIDIADVAQMRARSYCTELQKEPFITELFNASDAMPACESLMGEGNVTPAGSGQIALRFPLEPGKQAKDFNGHIDGIGTGINGIPKGEFRRGFTTLCVVLLDDVPEPHWGNFTVWPGSHHLVADALRTRGIESLSEGTPDVGDPGPPLMITGKQGDVVLAHYLTLHSVAPHIGPRIRYATIFRIRHVDVSKNGEAAYTDKWLEFEPLHGLDQTTGV